MATEKSTDIVEVVEGEVTEVEAQVEEAQPVQITLPKGFQMYVQFSASAYQENPKIDEDIHALISGHGIDFENTAAFFEGGFHILIFKVR